MKRSAILSSVVSCLVAAVLAATVGCSSGPDTAGTVDSMGTFGIETAKVNDGIDQALRSLEELVGTQGDDLKTPFAAYSKSLADLEKQAEVVRERSDEMKAKGDEFFKEWEADASATVDPDRRAKLSVAYTQIKGQMMQARDGFTPFLKSLKDIESYLKLDLTRKGLASVSEQLVADAKANGAEVKSSIVGVIQQVNSVRGMLAASTEE